MFFYCKQGQPLGDHLPRVLVGVGRVLRVGPLTEICYGPARSGHPLWDRLIGRLSVPDRPGRGFLPALTTTSRPPATPTRTRTASSSFATSRSCPTTPKSALSPVHGAELGDADLAVGILVKLLTSVEAAGARARRRKVGGARGVVERPAWRGMGEELAAFPGSARPSKPWAFAWERLARRGWPRLQHKYSGRPLAGRRVDAGRRHAAAHETYVPHLKDLRTRAP